MTEFKVGDRVRLTGADWENNYVLPIGKIVAIDEVGPNDIWAGEAGTVGNSRGLYSKDNPEGSGDYSCELVSGNSEEAIRNRRDSFVEMVAKLTGSGPTVSKEEIEEIATLGEEMGISSFEQSVRRHTDRIANLLIEKNKQYSNSALDPIRVFSKADRTEQLRVRADDKLSRIRNGDTSEDALTDLAGYIILMKIAEESA